MKEIWKPVQGQEGYLEVSNLGRVKRVGYSKYTKSLSRKLGILTLSGRPYYRVAHIRVHEMVARAFIPNPENKPQIDHIDNNPYNNRVDNLRWVTGKENMSNPHTRKNCSESAKRKFQQTPELRQIYSERAKGRKSWNKGKTKETDPRIKSAWNKGLKIGDDPRIKSSWSKGLTKYTDERLAKMGAHIHNLHVTGKLVYHHTEDAKKRIGDALRGKPLSEEHKLKISIKKRERDDLAKAKRNLEQLE